MSAHELELRQQRVLSALLRGEVPDGFDPRCAAMTTRSLLRKRRGEAVAAVPALRDVDDLAERFDAWAARHDRCGCAHDDVVDFVADVPGPLPEPLASVRAVERVYRRRAIIAHDRRPLQRPWVVAVGRTVHHLGPVNRAAPTGARHPSAQPTSRPTLRYVRKVVPDRPSASAPSKEHNS